MIVAEKAIVVLGLCSILSNAACIILLALIDRKKNRPGRKGGKQKGEKQNAGMQGAYTMKRVLSINRAAQIFRAISGRRMLPGDCESVTIEEAGEYIVAPTFGRFLEINQIETTGETDDTV